MAKKTDEREHDWGHRHGVAGLVFVAIVLIGIGIGILTGLPGAFILIFIGLAFLAMAGIRAYYNRN